MKTKASKILNLILIFAAVLSACFTVGLTVRKNNNAPSLLAEGVVYVGDNTGVTYSSLTAALEAASDGDTLTLVGALETETATTVIDKNVTINLNGKNLTIKGAITTAEMVSVSFVSQNAAAEAISGASINSSLAIPVTVGANSTLSLSNLTFNHTYSGEDNAFAISTSSQSEVYINNTTISGDVYLFETAFMQIGGVCQVGTFHVWPTFNPIYIENATDLNGNTEHSIKINYVKLNNGNITSYSASELLTLDLDSRSVVYFEADNTQVTNIHNIILFQNLEKYMVNIKITEDGGSTLYITEAEVGYKETGASKYIYTSFEYALQVAQDAQNAGKNWEVYFFKNLDLSSEDAGFTVNSTPASLTFTTDVVNAGKTDESYTKQTLKVKEFIFDCAINLNSGIVLEANNGITFNKLAVLNNEASIIVNPYIEAKSNLTLNNSALINGQVKAYGIITLNDSSKILYKGSVGVYLSGASSQVVLGWDSLNGQIRAVDAVNAEKTRTTGVYSDGSADIYIATWAGRAIAPIVIANNLNNVGHIENQFNNNKPIVLNATKPVVAVTVATQQTGANAGLLSGNAFKLTNRTDSELYNTDYSLRRNYNNTNANTSDDYLELTNEVNFLIHYSSDVAVSVNGSGDDYLATSLQTLLDAKKGNARAGLALVGYNFDGSENTATIGSFTVKYLKDNDISDIYACYTLTTYGEFKYLDTTEKVTFETFKLKYDNETLPNSSEIKAPNSDPTNTGFYFDGWYERKTSEDPKILSNYKDNSIDFSGERRINYNAGIENGEVYILTAYAKWYKKVTIKQASSGWGFDSAVQSGRIIMDEEKIYYIYSVSGDQEYSVSSSIKPKDSSGNDVTITGYTFYRWTIAEKGEGGINLQLSHTDNTATVYASWQATITFETYVQNTNLIDYTCDLSVESSAYVVSEVSVSGFIYATLVYIDNGNLAPEGYDYEHIGFTHAKYNLFGEEDTDFEKDFLLEPGTIKVYYNRNTYTVTLNESTSVDSITASANGTDHTTTFDGYYGVEYTLSATPAEGYHTPTFTATGATLTEGNKFTMPNNAVIITATATAKGVVEITTLPTASAITYGQTLESSTLTGGVATVAGSFAFEDTSISPSVSDSNRTEYTVVFNPEDTTLYKTQTCKVTITVNKATLTVGTITVGEMIYGNSLSDATISYSADDIKSEITGQKVTVSLVAFKEPTTKPTCANSNLTEYIIVVTPTDTSNYNPKEVAVKITVNKANLTITGDVTASITYGENFGDISSNEINATINGIPGETASIRGRWDTIDNATPIPSVGTYTKTTTFWPTGSLATNYKEITCEIKITVNEANLKITGLTASAITYGENFSNSSITAATITGVNGETFTKDQGSWDFTDFEELPNAGPHNVSVKFTLTGNDNYLPKTTTVIVTVNQKTLTITDVVGNDITYGQNFSVLNCTDGSKLTATITGFVTGDSITKADGTWAFTDAESIPNARTHTNVEATFTPTNTNYAAVTVYNAKVKVNPAQPKFPTSVVNLEYGKTLENHIADLKAFIKALDNTTTLDGSITSYSVSGYSSTDVLPIANSYTFVITFDPTDNNYATVENQSITVNIVNTSGLVEVEVNLTQTTITSGQTLVDNKFDHIKTNQLTITFTANTGYTLPTSIDVSVNGTAENRGSYTISGTTATYTLEATYIVGNVEITVISSDITDPTISEVKATAYNTLQFKATDGVGIVAYAVTTTASYTGATWNSVTETTNLTKPHTITSMAAGTYYVWVKDAAGNVSDSSTISAYTIKAYKGTNSNISSVEIDENNSTSIIALSGSQIHISATPVANAAFEGWHTSSTAPASYTLTGNPQEITVGAANANYYAFAKMLTAKYKVEAYLESTTLGTYEITPEYTIDTFSGTIGTQTNVQITDLRDDITGFNKPTSITQQTITAGDFTTIVKVYYNRKTYTITKNEGANTTLSITPSADDKYYYGIEYTVTATPIAPYTAVNVSVSGASYYSASKKLVMNSDSGYSETVTVTSTALNASDVTLTITNPDAITYRPAGDNNQTITLNTTVTGGVNFNYAITSGNTNGYFSITATTLTSLEDPILTVKAGTPSGLYTLTITATEATSGENDECIIVVGITKATITTLNVSPTSLTKRFGINWQTILHDINVTKTAQITLAKGGTFDVPGEWSYDKTPTEKPSARAEAYVVNFTFTPDSNYQLPTPAPTLQVSVTIINRDFTTTTLTFTRNPASETYSGSAHSFTLAGTVKDYAGGIVEPIILIKDSEGNTVTEAVDAGEYTFTYTFAKNNYNTITETKTLTITKANVNFAISQSEFTYNYNDKTWAEIENDIKAKITAKNASYAGVDVAYTPEFTGQPDVLNAGEYEVTVAITPNLSNNYNTPDSKTVTITINKIEGDLTFTYSGDKNPDNGNFLLTYGDNKNVTVSGTVGDESFAVMHFGKTAVWSKPATLNKADISFTNGDGSITYLTAKLTGNTINVDCDYVDTVKTIYIYAESANYTYVGSFTVELLKASLTIDGSFAATQSAYFNGLVKAPDFGTYKVQETANGDNYTIAPNLISLKKGETDLFLDTSKVVGVGKYTFEYEYAHETANYGTNSITITLTINQAQLSAPNGLTWVKGTAKWNKVTTFVHGENVAGITVTYKVYLNGTEVTGKTNTDHGTYLSCDLTSLLQTAGTYTFTVQAISSVQTNCAHSAVSGASSNQYVTKLVGEATQTGYTLTIGGNTVTNAAGVYIISGESLEVSATMNPGYTFSRFNSNNAAVTFTSETRNPTTLTFTTTSEIPQVEISVLSNVKQYTVNITKDAGVTLLAYKVKTAAKFDAILGNNSLTLDALTEYVFKYEVSPGYKLISATLFGQSYTDVKNYNIEHTQDTDTPQSISIRTELIQYTIKVQVPTAQSTYGSAYINTTNNFEGITTQELSSTGFNKTIAYLKATPTNDVDYQFAGYTVDKGDYIALANANSLETSISTKIFGHEDVTITITANFNLVGQRTVVYEFYQMEKDGTTGAAKHTIVAEGIDLNSTITAASIYEAFATKASEYFVQNGIILKTIKVTLGGVESNLFTATATTNAYANIAGYKDDIEGKSDITLTDNLTILFYFERLQYNVTINYKNADGYDTTTGIVPFYYGATITYPTVQNHNTTNEFKVTLNYRDYVTANEEKTQTIVNSLSKWNVNGTDTEIANIPASVGTEHLVITAVYEGAAQQIELPSTPTRTGYTFVGWFDNINGTGTAITSITNKLTANVTYYAKWSLNSPTITSTEFDAQTYTGSEIEFTATFSHPAGEFNKTGESIVYLWKFGESEKSSNQTLNLTNVNESGDYTISIILTDADGLTATASQTVTITINKATLSLSDLIYIDLDGNDGTTTDQYYLNEYLTTKTLPTLYTSNSIPTIHFKAQNDGSKVSSLAWTKYVSLNNGEKVAKTGEDEFVNLFAEYNTYYFTAVPKDENNFENFDGSFQIKASAVELAGIKASYTVPNGVKIYGSAEIGNLKKLFGAGNVYYLQILLVYNDGTTEGLSLSVADNLEAITISVNKKTSGKLSAAGISYAENGVCLDVEYNGKEYNNDDPNYSTYITVTEVVIETFTATATPAITDKQYYAFDTITADISALTVLLIYNDGSSETLSYAVSYEDDGYIIDYPSDAGGYSGFRAGDTSFEVVYKQDQTRKCSITLNKAVEKATLTEESDLVKALQKEYSTEYGKTLAQIETELLVVNNVKFKTGTDLTPVLNVGEYKNYKFIFNPDTENYEDYTIEQNIITLTITTANLDIAILGNANIAYDKKHPDVLHYVSAQVNSYVSASAPITIYYSLTPLNEDNYDTKADGFFALEITDGSLQNLTGIYVQNEGDSETVFYYIVSDNNNYNVVSGSKTIAISGLTAVTVTISGTEFELTYGTPISVTITAKETTSGNSVTIDNGDVSIYFGTTRTDVSNNTSDNVSVSFNAGTLTLTPGKFTESKVYVKIIINSTTHGFNTDGYIITITNVNRANRTIYWHETDEEIPYEEIPYSGEAKDPTKNLVYAPALETEKGETAIITYSFFKSYTGGTLGELLGTTAPTAVGTYYVVAEVRETDYYNKATTSNVLTFKISVAEANITAKFVTGKTYVYNGQNQTVTQNDLVVEINDETSLNYTISYRDASGNDITNIKDAGVYKVVVTSNVPNFTGEAELDWTIAKFTDTSKVSVTTTTASLTYNGNVQSLANLKLSVDFGGTTEILTVGDTGITASYAASDWKNAGNHSVTITANTTNFEFNVTNTYTINAIVLTSADVTFDPKTGNKFRWAEGENHTVTASIIDGKVVAGDSVVLTLEGATFGAEGEHTVTVTGTNNSNYIIERDGSGNSTIKATYYVIRYFNLIFDANEHGGYFGEDKTKVQEYANNTQNINLLTFAKPERDGYIFVGWAENTNTTDTITFVSINNENKTLYAVYSKDITLTVYYLNNSLTEVAKESITKILYNKATKASFNIKDIKTKAENVSPNGYTLKQIGEAGLRIFDLSEDTVLKAYYNKPIVLTMVVTGAQSQTTQNAVYKLNELNEFVKAGDAEFALEVPSLNPGDGKFKAWAIKNTDDTYTLLEAQNKYTYNKDTAILALDSDLTIYALVEAEVSYGGFIKGIAIFIIALIGLIILLAIFNKNKKRKAVANVPNQSSGSDNVDYGAFYDKTNRHHERISNKLRKEHDNKLMEENYSQLINKNNVNNETTSQATHQPINNSYNTQNYNTNNSQTNSQYNAAQNSANKPYTEYTNSYYNTNNQSNYYGSSSASAQNGAAGFNNSGAANTNAAPNANNNAQSAGNTSAASSDIQSILDKYKNLGSNNSNGGSNNGSN